MWVVVQIFAMVFLLVSVGAYSGNSSAMMNLTMNALSPLDEEQTAIFTASTVFQFITVLGMTVGSLMGFGSDTAVMRKALNVKTLSFDAPAKEWSCMLSNWSVRIGAMGACTLRLTTDKEGFLTEECNLPQNDHISNLCALKVMMPQDTGLNAPTMTIFVQGKAPKLGMIAPIFSHFSSEKTLLIKLEKVVPWGDISSCYKKYPSLFSHLVWEQTEFGLEAQFTSLQDVEDCNSRRVEVGSFLKQVLLHYVDQKLPPFSLRPFEDEDFLKKSQMSKKCLDVLLNPDYDILKGTVALFVPQPNHVVEAELCNSFYIDQVLVGGVFRRRVDSFFSPIENAIKNNQNNRVLEEMMHAAYNGHVTLEEVDSAVAERFVVKTEAASALRHIAFFPQAWEKSVCDFSSRANRVVKSIECSPDGRCRVTMWPVSTRPFCQTLPMLEAQQVSYIKEEVGTYAYLQGLNITIREGDYLGLQLVFRLPPKNQDHSHFSKQWVSGHQDFAEVV